MADSTLSKGFLGFSTLGNASILDVNNGLFWKAVGMPLVGFRNGLLDVSLPYRSGFGFEISFTSVT